MVNLQLQLLKVAFHVVWIVKIFHEGRQYPPKWRILAFVRKASYSHGYNIFATISTKILWKSILLYRIYDIWQTFADL